MGGIAVGMFGGSGLDKSPAVGSEPGSDPFRLVLPSIFRIRWKPSRSSLAVSWAGEWEYGGVRLTARLYCSLRTEGGGD